MRQDLQLLEISALSRKKRPRGQQRQVRGPGGDVGNFVICVAGKDMPGMLASFGVCVAQELGWSKRKKIILTSHDLILDIFEYDLKFSSRNIDGQHITLHLNVFCLSQAFPIVSEMQRWKSCPLNCPKVNILIQRFEEHKLKKPLQA